MHRRLVSLVAFFILVSGAWWSITSARQQSPGASTRLTLQFRRPWTRSITLTRGETIEISVGLPQPSSLPVNGRVEVRWTLKQSGAPLPAMLSRAPDAFGIYTAPTANWSKTLHALDPDVYVVYRAPVEGEYALEIAPVTAGPAVFEGARWREDGIAPQAVSFPRNTPWPPGKIVPIEIAINPVSPADPQSRDGSDAN